MKGHEMIDIEVVHRWDDASLKMLYSHYYKALVAFSAQMVEHQEAAEELVQDAFVSLWQQRNTFQSAATLRAYLYNTVRNKSISWLRHERVERSRIEAFERDFRHSIEGFLDERAARCCVRCGGYPLLYAGQACLLVDVTVHPVSVQQFIAVYLCKSYLLFQFVYSFLIVHYSPVLPLIRKNNCVGDMQEEKKESASACKTVSRLF